VIASVLPLIVPLHCNHPVPTSIPNSLPMVAKQGVPKNPKTIEITNNNLIVRI
jgi:hypothetical protein